MSESTTKSSLSLDLSDNPELQEILADYSPGDRLSLRMDLMVTVNDGEKNFSADIEGVEADGESAEVSPEEPVLAILVSKSKRPAKDAPVSDEEDTDDELDEEDEG